MCCSIRLESEKFVLEMSVHYQSMLVLFEKWASDCTLFVKGEESLFPELVHKDDQYNMLLQPNEEIDQSTIQCLELIFGSFIVVSNQMLKDHLKGGKYADPSRELMISQNQHQPPMQKLKETLEFKIASKN